MQAYTDYPIEAAGDAPYVPAPIRRVTILEYDGDKYCRVLVEGVEDPQEIKAGYLYTAPGRLGTVPKVSLATLIALTASPPL